MRSCAQRSGIPAPRRFGPDPSRSCFLLLRPDGVLLRLFFLFHMQPSVSPISLQGRGHLRHSHVCLCRDAIRGCTLMNAFASGPQQLLLSRRASDFLIKRPQEFFAHFAKQPPHYFAQLSPQETQVQRGQGHTVAYTQLPTHPSTSLLKKKAASRGSSHFRGPLSPWDGLEGPWTNS